MNINFTVDGKAYKLFSEFNADYDCVCFGWNEADKGTRDNGFMYNGKPYSVQRAKWSTMQQAEDDFVDYARYHHMISRTTARQH